MGPDRAHRRPLGLLLAAALVLCLAPETARAANVLVDVPTIGTPLPAESVGSSEISGVQAISGNGRYAVFDSESDGLLDGDDDQATNVYRKDLVTGDVVLISKGSSGPGFSGAATIDDDGGAVAFVSSLALTADDQNPGSDVFKATIANDGSVTLTLVSCPTSGCANTPHNSSVSSSAISGNGQTVAWLTDAALAAGDTNNSSDVYARTGSTTTPISVRDGGTAFQSGFTDFAIAIDTAGDRIAFATTADLTPAATDTNSTTDVYVRAPGSNSTYLISHNVSATPVAVGGQQPDISDDGVHASFATTNNLLPGDTNGRSDIYVGTVAAPGSTAPKLASAVDGSTTASADASSFGSLSGDGGHVAFESSGAVVGGIGSGQTRIYVRDLTSNSTALASRANDGSVPATSFATLSALSANGTHLVFQYSGDALTTDSDGLTTGVMTRDLGNGTTASVARPPGGAPFRHATLDSAISSQGNVTSADDRYVVFGSFTQGLADPAGAGGVYRRDLLTGTTARVDVAPGGGAPNGSADSPTISADGNKIAFESNASNLVGDDTNGAIDVFVRDMTTGTITRVDKTTSGGQAASAAVPRIAAGGSRVVFGSFSKLDPVDDTNSSFDFYVADATGGGVQVVSRATGAGGAAVTTANTPSISADGNRVAFTTSSGTIGDGDTNVNFDIHVRDIASDTTIWASPTASGTASNGVALQGQMSADGSQVAFTSTASNLGDGDIDSNEDVHVRTLGTTTVTWATREPGASGGALSSGPVAWSLSPDGSQVAFGTTDPNVITPDTNGSADDYVRTLATGATVRALVRADGSQSNAFAIPIDFSGSGGCLVIAGNDPALVTGGYTSTDFAHVYVSSFSDRCRAPLSPSTGGGTTPPPPPPAGPPPAPKPDKTAPKLSKLKFSATKFRVGKAKTKKGKKAPLGTKLGGTIDEDATLTFTIEKKTTGRKVGHKCEKATRKNRKKKKCTLLVRVKTVTAKVKKGKLKVAFKPAGVKPGSYEASITAKDAAKNKSKAKVLKFTIVS